MSGFVRNYRDRWYKRPLRWLQRASGWLPGIEWEPPSLKAMLRRRRKQKPWDGTVVQHAEPQPRIMRLGGRDKWMVRVDGAYHCCPIHPDEKKLVQWMYKNGVSADDVLTYARIGRRENRTNEYLRVAFSTVDGCVRRISDVIEGQSFDPTTVDSWTEELRGTIAHLQASARPRPKARPLLSESELTLGPPTRTDFPYMGYNCIVHENALGWVGYVPIPENHPWHGLNATELEHHFPGYHNDRVITTSTQLWVYYGNDPRRHGPLQPPGWWLHLRAQDTRDNAEWACKAVVDAAEEAKDKQPKLTAHEKRLLKIINALGSRL